jgi:CubicO group peptidase (beta-lactamase class C family)
VWQVGDVVLYAIFFAMGVLAREGAFDRLSRPQWLAVALGSATVAAVWWVTQPVPEGIVNNSHPVHLLVGLAWLALAMMARNVLRRGTTNAVTGPVVRFLSRRSLTVYLWHTSAIVLALWFVNRTADLPPGVWTFSYLVLVAAGTVGATILFGWVEDKAARRPARVWPLPLPPALERHRGWAVMALPVVAVLLLALVLPTAPAERSEVAFKPRVPSQAPPPPQIAEPNLQPVDAGPALLTPAVIDAEALQRVIDEWQDEYAIPGVSVAVTAPNGDEFIATQGVRDDGEDRSVSDQLDLMSITKLFTANLVYRAVDAGLLDLDAPIPALDAEPDFPYAGQLTVRQLLGHRSGIINYRDSSRYAADPNSVASVSDAISSSVADPLIAEPGSISWYSSTNYLVLGRVLEQVTGVDYDELLFRELLIPLGLASATHLPPDVGEPRYATAGLLTDIGDLGRAGIALLRDHVGVSDTAYSVMLDIDEATGLGPGLNGFCPCSRDIDGSPQWFGLGYTGGSTMLLYLPTTDIVVAIDLTEGLYSIDGRFDAAIELARRIAAMVSLPQEATEPV